MAGSNNLPKYALWNREDELIEFKLRGPRWGQVTGNLITSATLLQTDLLLPFYLSSATPNSITGPSATSILSFLFGQGYLTTVGSTYQITIQNTDSVAKTITFPGIGAVSIPANSFYTLGFVVQPPVAPSVINTIAFYQPVTTVTAAGGDPLPSLGSGYVVKVSPGNYITANIVGTTPVIVTGGSGTTGTTTVALDTALTQLDTALTTQPAGILVTQGVGVGDVSRVIVGTSPIVVTNGSGAAGNPTISINPAALTITATNVSVGPPVLGQTNVQAALTSLAAAIPTIPSGTGYVVQTAPGTFVNRTFVAGLNIALTNPAGTAGATTIALTPVGVQTPVTINSGVNAYTGANDIFVWTTAIPQWNTASNLAANALATAPNFYVPGNTILGMPTANWDVTGRNLDVESAGWGVSGAPFKTIAGIQTAEVSTGNLQSTGNFLLTFRQTPAAAVNSSTFTYRVISYQTASTSAGQNYNTVAGFTELFSVVGNGNVNGQTFQGLAFTVVSSKETKKDISPISEVMPKPALELIKSVNPVSFRYKQEDADSPKRSGLIVEELAGFLDHLVHDGKGLKLDQVAIFTLQLAKELAAEVEKLKADIQKLRK